MIASSRSARDIEPPDSSSPYCRKYPESFARCVPFGQRPQTISMFDATARLTRIEQKIEHASALTGGLIMGAHSYLASLVSSARSNNLGQSPIARCDHCRAEVGPGAHRYWRMQFCSAACMTAYQDRLGAETRLKIEQCALISDPAA